MEFTLIDDKEAPENLSAMSAEAKEKLALIRALKPGKTARVPLPQDKETRRGFKASLTRVATNQTPKVALEIWDDAEAVYVRLAKTKEPTTAPAARSDAGS